LTHAQHFPVERSPSLPFIPLKMPLLTLKLATVNDASPEPPRRTPWKKSHCFTHSGPCQSTENTTVMRLFQEKSENIEKLFDVMIS
jgi:hypothetical protein